ncbi:MAG: ATP-binding protein [Bacteroidales bacterium]|jgi:hypothetical protein|nr:ATP-binding protein [Bacteroidales bacterium]
MNLINYTDSLDFCKNLIDKKIKIPQNIFLFPGKEFQSIQKIAKNICAIANTNSGEIYYGVTEKLGRAVKFSPIEKIDFDEEWLYYEIQSQIDKPIKNLIIKFHNIENNAKVIFFSIPLSNNQPHLFSDGKFYKWEKNKANQMNETEIRSLYGKTNVSELEIIGITGTNGLPILKDGKFSSVSFYPKIFIKNIGNTIEKTYKTEISFPTSLFEENFQPLKSIFIRFEGKYAVFSQSGNSTLFQNEINTAIEAKIAVNANNFKDFQNEFLQITLYYSFGIKQQKMKLSDIFTYNGKFLIIEDFII